jgi:hypothetical protein
VLRSLEHSVCDSFTCSFVLFNFRESPRFLITKGRDAEAVSVCQHIAKTNGRTCSLTIEQLEEIDAEAEDSASDADVEGGVITSRLAEVSFSHLRGLFANSAMVRLTLLTWIVYMADSW